MDVGAGRRPFYAAVERNGIRAIRGQRPGRGGVGRSDFVTAVHSRMLVTTARRETYPIHRAPYEVVQINLRYASEVLLPADHWLPHQQNFE